MSTEREDLEDLIRHPGWLQVCHENRIFWVEQIADRLRSAVNDTDDAMALSKMRQLIAAKDAVERFMTWPKEKLMTMARQANVEVSVEDSFAHSRRGSL